MGNRPALVSRLKEAASTLAELVGLLENADEAALRQFLAEAKELRDTVRPLPSKP
jgi:prephenate dehydrogenase